jgi:phosphoribosylamine-glycine ligase
MGAYAPAPIITSRLMETIQTTILNPTLKGMRKVGMNIYIYIRMSE